MLDIDNHFGIRQEENAFFLICVSLPLNYLAVSRKIKQCFIHDSSIFKKPNLDKF